jgi:hypothetical protein
VRGLIFPRTGRPTQYSGLSPRVYSVPLSAKAVLRQVLINGAVSMGRYNTISNIYLQQSQELKSLSSVIQKAHCPV